MTVAHWIELDLIGLMECERSHGILVLLFLQNWTDKKMEDS